MKELSKASRLDSMTYLPGYALSSTAFWIQMVACALSLIPASSRHDRCFQPTPERHLVLLGGIDVRIRAAVTEIERREKSFPDYLHGELLAESKHIGLLILIRNEGKREIFWE